MTPTRPRSNVVPFAKPRYAPPVQPTNWAGVRWIIAGAAAFWLSGALTVLAIIR